MSQADAERRLEVLEARARHVDLRPLAEAAAERLGFNVDELLAESERLAQRVEEIGFPAVQAELAEQAARLAASCGVTVEQLYVDVDELLLDHDHRPFGV